MSTSKLLRNQKLGYRLVYSVEDQTITVTVIAVSTRDRNEIYDIALARSHDKS